MIRICAFLPVHRVIAKGRIRPFATSGWTSTVMFLRQRSDLRSTPRAQEFRQAPASSATASGQTDRSSRWRRPHRSNAAHAAYPPGGERGDDKMRSYSAPFVGLHMPVEGEDFGFNSDLFHELPGERGGERLADFDGPAGKAEMANQRRRYAESLAAQVRSACRAGCACPPRPMRRGSARALGMWSSPSRSPAARAPRASDDSMSRRCRDHRRTARVGSPWPAIPSIQTK